MQVYFESGCWQIVTEIGKAYICPFILSISDNRLTVLCFLLSRKTSWSRAFDSWNLTEAGETPVSCGSCPTELTTPGFWLVLTGSLMSYHCPPQSARGTVLYTLGPLMQHIQANISSPGLQQLMHPECPNVSPQLSEEIMKRSNQTCPTLGQPQWPRQTISCFHQVYVANHSSMY